MTREGVGCIHDSGKGKKYECIIFFSLVFYCLGEDACAIGRGTYIKKKSDLQKKILGQVRTAVPWEGVG